MIYKRECINCINCEDQYCEIYDIEIIIGRMNLSNTCNEWEIKKVNNTNA